MVVCETLPLCPDTVVSSEISTVLTEPMEVGPYSEGILFVKVMSKEGPSALNAEVGISPYGYDDWDEHWVVRETLKLGSEGLTSHQLTNFGNWLRIRFALSDAGGKQSDTKTTVQAWFVGKG